MASRPVLVFVKGVQASLKMVLPADKVVVGRSPSCQIILTEEHASRQQMAFERLAEGWTVENLSANGTWISGKKYKTGKKILLATGDLVRVGADTEILYVESAGDVAKALADYQATHASAAPVAVPPPAPAVAEAQEDHAEAVPAAPLPARQEVKPVAESLEPAAAEPKKPSKIKKYAILFGIYAAVMVALVVILSSLKNTPGTVKAGQPPQLNATDIADAVNKPYVRAMDRVQAEDMLRKAIAFFPDRHFKAGNLYECVKYFKLHLAYAHRPEYEDVEYARMYQRANQELLDKVQNLYITAWKFEQAGNWKKAQARFEELLLVYPDPENPIIVNSMAHLGYVKKQLPQRRGIGS